MPQMMPLNWLTLSLYFSILLITFAIMNYYTPFYKTSLKSTSSKPSPSMTWKW